MPRPSVAVIVALLLGLVACKRSTEQPPPAGNVAEGLALPTLDDVPFDPATLAGKPTIVMFWRTGCKYCMNEMPSVAKAAAAQGANAIAVMIAGNEIAARKAARTFDGGTILVDDGSLRERYKITKVPYTLILRGDGTAARAFLGEQSERTLASAVASVK